MGSIRESAFLLSRSDTIASPTVDGVGIRRSSGLLGSDELGKADRRGDFELERIALEYDGSRDESGEVLLVVVDFSCFRGLIAQEGPEQVISIPGLSETDALDGRLVSACFRTLPGRLGVAGVLDERGRSDKADPSRGGNLLGELERDVSLDGISPVTL